MLRRLLLPLVVALSFFAASPAMADTTTLKVAHGSVSAQLVPVTPGTPSAGDLRTYYADLTKPGTDKRIGFLTGSLLTTTVGEPSAGKEYRAADLVFTIGKSADQLVVGGVAVYEQTAPTVARRTSVVRPVVGGSGEYAGAHGWCKSIHLKDGTWRHVFHFRTIK